MTHPDRTSGCAIATPTLVYAWPKSRSEFDRLQLPLKTYPWQHCDIVTLCKRDGQQWETQMNAKTIEANGVTVVFQWRDERPARHREAA